MICVLCLVLSSVLGARFKDDKYKYKNFYYRKGSVNKINLLLDNILDGHPTQKEVIQKARSIEKFLFEMPDPSVNGGYKQMLREQRKQREEMDIQMRKTRNEMRERALNKILDRNAQIPDEEGKLFKQILENRAAVNRKCLPADVAGDDFSSGMSLSDRRVQNL